MKLISILIPLVVATVALLTGCEPSAKVRTYPVLPDELKDCKFFYLNGGDGVGSITVGRCPNSTTTVQMNNKARTTTVVIDGKEYVTK